jgi:hypothetical protein
MNIRSFRPAYFFKRLGQMRFEKSYPDVPWLAESAVLLLDSYLKPTDVGFEWGSGRSTLWLAQRVAHLHSVEDNSRWYRAIEKELRNAQLIPKITYQFIPCEWTEVDEPSGHPYADAANAFPDNSLDFALVDGNIRASCMQVMAAKLKPGGLLILDNANRFLPNRYLDSHTTVHECRSEPRSAAWARVMENLKDWRWMSTTNGIWDTRFWIKPLNTSAHFPEMKTRECLIHKKWSQLPL